MKYKIQKRAQLSKRVQEFLVKTGNLRLMKSLRRKKRHLKTRGLEKIKHKRVQNNGAICYVRRYIYSVART